MSGQLIPSNLKYSQDGSTPSYTDEEGNVIQRGSQIRIRIKGIRGEIGNMFAIGTIREDYLGYVFPMRGWRLVLTTAAVSLRSTRSQMRDASREVGFCCMGTVDGASLARRLEVGREEQINVLFTRYPGNHEKVNAHLTSQRLLHLMFSLHTFRVPKAYAPHSFGISVAASRGAPDAFATRTFCLW